VSAGIKAFNILTQYISKVIQQQANLQLEDILGLQVSLVNFALKAYPEQMKYVDHILRFCGQFIEKKTAGEALSSDCIEHVEQLLTIPLRTYKSVMDVLELQHYTGLLQCLEAEQKRNVAVQVAKSVVRNQTLITDIEKMDRLLDLLKPLLEEQEDDASMDEDAIIEFKEQQALIAALVHLVYNENPDDMYKLLQLLRKRMGTAGPKRIGITMPGLVMSAIKLAVRARQLEHAEQKDFQISAKKVLEFVHQTMTKALGPEYPEVTFRLYLNAAQASNVCGFSNITYEFTTQAYYLYETAIADSKAQIDAITLMVGHVQNLRILSEEEYETFSTKTTLYASRLLRKSDQCRMLSLCANLFWSPESSEENPLDLLAGPHQITIRHGKRAVEALRRAVKMASECEANFENVPLYVDLLNVYLYHYGRANESIDVKWVNALVSLIKDNINNLPGDSDVIEHYQRTVQFIRKKAAEDPRYSSIDLLE